VAHAIAVANAGSSSLKFSLFVTHGLQLELDVHGQVEAIQTAPRFVAKRPDGTTLETKSWPEGARIGHEGALDFVMSFLRSRLTEYRLLVSGISSDMRTLLASNDAKAKLAVDLYVYIHSAISLNIECIRHAFINFTATPYHLSRMTSLASLLS
jgi:acetate kinase